jgi:hypothetical protein
MHILLLQLIAMTGGDGLLDPSTMVVTVICLSISGREYEHLGGRIEGR